MMRPYSERFKSNRKTVGQGPAPPKTNSSRLAYEGDIGLAVGRGVEGDVDYGFEFDGGALFGGGAELPLAEGVHGVGIKLLVDAADQLNAVDRAVTTNYGVEDDFTFDVLVY